MEGDGPPKNDDVLDGERTGEHDWADGKMCQIITIGLGFMFLGPGVHGWSAPCVPG